MEKAASRYTGEFYLAEGFLPSSDSGTVFRSLEKLF